MKKCQLDGWAYFVKCYDVSKVSFSDIQNNTLHSLILAVFVVAIKIICLFAYVVIMKWQ